MSGAFVHVLLAHHYMHEYWLEGGRGLVFPGAAGRAPATPVPRPHRRHVRQVSDVTTESAAMRRLVLLHGLVAFLFNAVIVGAAVSIAAGIVR